MDENETGPQKSIGDKIWRALLITSRYLLILNVALIALWAVAMLFMWITGALPE